MAPNLMTAHQAETNPLLPHIRAGTQAAAPAGVPAAVTLPVPATPPGKTLFSETLLEMSLTRERRGKAQILTSILFHVVVLVALILPSLYFTDTIDLKGFAQTFLVAPPPPPPPAPMAKTVAKVAPIKKVFISGGKLLAPTVIPQEIAMLKEEPLQPDMGVEGGVPGGVTGGQAGGVIGGIISAARTNIVLAAPKAPQPVVPLRVGGHVRAPRLINRREPEYPVLAKQAGVSGSVVIDAVIDSQGNVVEMQIVSGKPLLIQGALDAVSHWKYEPTYLNDEPVPVRLYVTVVFELHH
jgi:protein TonB